MQMYCYQLKVNLNSIAFVKTVEKDDAVILFFISSYCVKLPVDMTQLVEPPTFSFKRHNFQLFMLLCIHLFSSAHLCC